MNIAAVEQALTSYMKQPNAYNNGRNLLIYLSQYLIDKEKSPKPTSVPFEPWVSLMEFYAKTQICHPSTLIRLMNNDSQFLHTCCLKTPSKAFVKIKSTANYLANCNLPKVRRKAREYLNNKLNENENCQLSLL